MSARPPLHEFGHLFANHEPATVWEEAAHLIGEISPAYDLKTAKHVFDDIMQLFLGEYPGYCEIKTPYHDLPHTLDVFLCAARLMHGMYLAGNKPSDRDIDLVLLATLMHDIGYAQKRDGRECGTGAQYTPVHIKRGQEFMRNYIGEHGLPADYADDLVPIISCSDPVLPITQIAFPDEHVRMLGQVLGTADLVGQMADRNYLEKLVFLFEEFQEANLNLYKDVRDMMRKTHEFHLRIQKKLDEEFAGLYHKLQPHFLGTLGEDRNFYMESIRKNLEYLARIVDMDEAECFNHLRRGGIISKYLAEQSEKSH